MKKYFLLIILFISLGRNAYSQEYYDLIVMTNGDSIACNIDSITDTHIFFKMKYRNNWGHTYIDKSILADFKQNALDKELVHFKPGTSYIIIPVKKTNNNKNSISRNNLNLNLLGSSASIYAATYERKFLLKPNYYLTFGLGIGINVEETGILSSRTPDNYMTIPYNLIYNYGKKIHYLLFGLGSTIMIGNVQQEYYIYPIFGYRKQPSNRFNYAFYLSYPLGQKVTDIVFYIPVGFSLGLSF